MAEMSYKLAIDFGTTNTIVARWNGSTSAAEIISLPDLSLAAQPPLIPSLVYVEEGQTSHSLIGQAVIDRGWDRHSSRRLFRNFKRGIVASPPTDPREIDGAWWTDRMAGQTFLQRIIQALPYPIDDLDQLVLSAPVASFDNYLGWLNDTFASIAPDKIRVVDESTAAALGYGITEPEALVFVVDFGGGTLDVSLVQLPHNRDQAGGILRRLLKGHVSQYSARVIAKAGRVIGGSDVDQWLMAEMLRRTGISIEALGDGTTPLLTACEQAKIALSTKESAVIEFEADTQSHQVTITRDDLERLLEANGFYAAVRCVIDKVMHVAHRRSIFKEDINTVLMVGGTALMPAVQRVLKEYFSDQAVRADKPFTAVAEGALQLAAGYGLEDYLIHSYGLRYLDPETKQHEYDEIIPMGARYPIDKPIDVMIGAAHADQREIELVIGEIDTDAVSMIEVKYEDGLAVFVAQADRARQQIVPINDPLKYPIKIDPPVAAGEDRIKVQFTVDDRRRLLARAFDLRTQQELLHQVVLADFGSSQNFQSFSDPTGREPHISSQGAKGQYRLSLRGLGTMLNVLPPESISLGAAAAALRSKDFFVRYNAAKILGKRGDRDARLVLHEVITTGDAPARASAARQLSGFSWFVAGPIAQQALNDTDSRVREGVVYALCDMRDLNAYQLLVDALQNETGNVRAAAAWGLRDCQDEAAVPVLAVVLRAIDPDVRVKGLEALGANQTSAAIPIVRRMLDDPDPDVQYAAALSWIELCGEACLIDLAGEIERSIGQKRASILRGFFHATNYLQMNILKSSAADRVIGAIEIALADPLAQARLAAIWPLAWIRHDRAPILLQQAYDREQDCEVKAHIVRVAFNLMSPAGDSIWQTAWQSTDEGVREMARQLAYEHHRQLP